MPDSPLQTTALTPSHEAMGARMAPFAGWSMPVEFAGTLTEHAAVRERVGAFDVSHLGTVVVTGSGAAEVIGRSFTCDTSAIAIGGSQYTMCCDEQGGVVDDLIVYRLGEDRWMVMPNAANTAVVVARLRDQAADRGAGTTAVDDQSTEQAVIAIQGPESLPLASTALGVDVEAIPIPTGRRCCPRTSPRARPHTSRRSRCPPPAPAAGRRGRPPPPRRCR